MTNTKIKWKIVPMILLVFFFSTSILAQSGYKIVSYKGKVKVKKDEGMILLKEQVRLTLKKDDAILLYPGAEIEIVFPGGKRETFPGPIYSTVENLGKTSIRDGLSFFEKPERWQVIKRIFDEEGDESIGTTRGTQVDSLNLFDEIKPVVTGVKIADKTLPPVEEKEMKRIVDAVHTRFDAFSEEKRVVLRSLVYKDFGLHETALRSIFSHYKEILHAKGKQRERELLEDYLYNQFLPILISIRPDEENHVQGKDPAVWADKEFLSNLKLWWAVFLFDGKELKTIEKTIDHSLHPQSIFRVKHHMIFDSALRTKGRKRTGSQCVIIVACADWSELERFDDMEIAKRELLAESIKETKSNTIVNYGKVIIKLCL